MDNQFFNIFKQIKSFAEIKEEFETIKTLRDYIKNNNINAMQQKLNDGYFVANVLNGNTKTVHNKEMRQLLIIGSVMSEHYLLAQRILEKSIPLYDNDAKEYLLESLGNIFYAQEKFSQAIESFSQIDVLSHLWSKLSFCMSLHYTHSGTFSQYTDILTPPRKTVTENHLLGIFAYQIKELKESEKLLQEAFNRSQLQRSDIALDILVVQYEKASDKQKILASIPDFCDNYRIEREHAYQKLQQGITISQPKLKIPFYKVIDTILSQD